MTYRSKTQCIFWSTSTVTIANTNVETTQFWAGHGSTTVKAKTLSVGDTIEIRTNVRLTTWISQEATFRVKIDWVTITSVWTLPNSLNQNHADFFFIIRVQSDGKLIVDWRTLINWWNGITSASVRAFPQQTPITVDLNSDFNIDITYQWTEADPGNILCVQQSMIHLNKI